MFWDGVCIGHPREQRGLHPSADARAVLSVVSTSCRATLPVVSTSAIASPIGRKIDISFKAGGTDYVDSGRIVCRFYVQWILKLSSDHLVQVIKSPSPGQSLPNPPRCSASIWSTRWATPFAAVSIYGGGGKSKQCCQWLIVVTSGCKFCTACPPTSATRP